MKLDDYSNEELTKLKLLSEADVTIDPVEMTKVKLKINPRFDANLQEGDNVDIDMDEYNLALIFKSKVLPQRIVEVQIKTLYQSWTVQNGEVLGQIKAFGALSGKSHSEFDLRVNDIEAEEGELITLDELCEICNDRSVTELDGVFSHQAVNASSRSCYKYKASRSKHLATFLKCSKL